MALGLWKSWIHITSHSQARVIEIIHSFFHLANLEYLLSYLVLYLAASEGKGGPSPIRKLSQCSDLLVEIQTSFLSVRFLYTKKPNVIDEYSTLWLTFMQERINLATWVAQTLQISKTCLQDWLLANCWEMSSKSLEYSAWEECFYMPGALGHAASLIRQIKMLTNVM